MRTRKEKEKIIKEFIDDLKKAKILVFTDYFGVRADELNQLRKTLKENGCKYQVIKKTFLEKVLEKEKVLEIEVKKLPGGLGVIFGFEDEVSGPKVALKFSKKEENFRIQGAIWQDKYLTDKDVLALAQSPSKEELIAKTIGTIKAPLNGFVNVLAGNLRGLVNTLNAIKPQFQQLKFDKIEDLKSIDVEVIKQENKSRLSRRMKSGHFVKFVELTN